MEPQGNQTPEAVPAPSSPETPEQAVSLEPVQTPSKPETESGREGANQNQTTKLPATDTTVAPAPVSSDESTDTATTTTDTPAIADDVDVIEKEWVDKAKQIVDENRQDPYKQNKQVSVLKADYMKKRYGKDIKLTED